MNTRPSFPALPTLWGVGLGGAKSQGALPRVPAGEKPWALAICQARTDVTEPLRES